MAQIFTSKILKFAFICSVCICFALQNSDLHAQQSSYTVSFLEDASKELSPNQLNFSNFEKSNNNSLNFGFYKGTIWVLIATKGYSEDALIELKNSNLDILTFYTIDSNKAQYQLKTGDYLKFHTRPIKHRFFQYPTQGSDSVLVKIENFGDQLFIPISVLDENSAKKQSYHEQIIFGTYYGLCLFAFLLNLFLYLRIRERANLFYSLYIVGLIALQLALDGHGYQYIWSNSVFIAQHAPPFFASFSVLFLLLFTQYFLNVKQLLPRFHKLLKVIGIIIFINLFLSVSPIFYAASILIINAFTLILNIIILPLTIAAVRKNFKPARFFLAAFILLILGVFTFILRNFGFLPSNFFSDYSLQIGSTAEVVLLSYAIVDKFNAYKEDALKNLTEINEIQAQQNATLEKEVALRMERITEQKNQLEHKNNEIIDSINYAKRIQDAQIPSPREVKKHLGESFVLWKPKDIVSGDFYWASNVVTTHKDQSNSKMILCCVGDCTGHGVPGAILSVLGLKILNLSLKNADVNTSSQALSYLNEEFSLTFSKGKENTIRDGMDISFCAIDFEHSKLYFSGAKNGIYIIREGNLIEIKGDRFSIGSEQEKLVFTQHQFDLQKNDLVVLYTDGYADQFGGARNKKFKYQTLKDLLLKNSHGTMDEIHQKLSDTFDDWKGDEEQTDDVCLLGFRV